MTFEIHETTPCEEEIGNKHFSNVQNFVPDNSSKKFPIDIENKITEYIIKRFKITYITLTIGRKEIEEYFLRYKPVYNSPSRRRHKS